MAPRAPQHCRCWLQLSLVGIISTAGSLAASSLAAQPRTQDSIDKDVAAHFAALEAKTADDSHKAEIQNIIHATSVLAGLADAGLAQIPGLGRMIVPIIQASMVASIGHKYGCYLDFANALAVVTYFSSDYLRRAVITEFAGFIPGFGNTIKGFVTGMNTEGIGQVAHRLLQCEGGDRSPRQDSLSLILAKGRETTEQFSQPARQLFYTVFDKLATRNLTSTRRWSRIDDEMKTAWQLVTNSMQRFFGQSQVQLMAEVKSAALQAQAGNESALQVLTQIIGKHAWNLEVMEEALAALIRTPDGIQACASVASVAQRLWIPGQADARGISAPYLSHCMQHADPITQREVARGAAQMLVDTRGGAQGGLSPVVVRQALELLAITVEAFSGHQGALVTAIALDIRELRAAIPATISALGRGEAAACNASSALLRAERRAASVIGDTPSGASVRHLSTLDRLQLPVGAETCVPQLREELVQQLTISSVPSSAMRPKAPTSRPSSSFGFALGAGSSAREPEEKLKSAVVGQQCMLERLWDQPGHVRLRYRGLWGHDKPLVLLLTGPSGTGKTMLARSLGEVLLGRPIAELEKHGRFKTFHMNQFVLVEDKNSFFGPPEGIKGTGDLPELLRRWPDAVILLDEVEKAHHSFASALLKVFGENGAVNDPKTKYDVPTTNATFILTSNLGKDLIPKHAAARSKGDGDPDCIEYGRLRDDVLDALKKTHISGRGNFFMESEMRSRLTDVLPFLPFSEDEVQTAVVRYLEQEARTFEKSPKFLHAFLAWEPEVVPFFAAEYTRRQEEGLRGVQTQLQSRVREVFDCAVATGLLQQYGEVVLRLRPHADSSKAQLDLHVIPPRPWSRPIATITQDSTKHFFTGTVEAFKRYALVKNTEQGSPDATSAGWQEQGMLHEFEQLWDWQLYWQQCLEVLWEYKYAIALTAVVIIAVALSAGSAAPAAPAAGVFQAVSGVTGTLAAAVQIAVPLGGFAAAALGAGVAWYHGWELLAVAVPVLMTYWAWRCLPCGRRWQAPEQQRHADRSAFFGGAGHNMHDFDDGRAAFGDGGMASSPMKRKRRQSGDEVSFASPTPTRGRSQPPQSPASAPPRSGGSGTPKLGQASRRLLVAQAPARPLVFSHQQE